jgi:hypothetical protein
MVKVFLKLAVNYNMSQSFIGYLITNGTTIEIKPVKTTTKIKRLDLVLLPQE